ARWLGLSAAAARRGSCASPRLLQVSHRQLRRGRRRGTTGSTAGGSSPGGAVGPGRAPGRAGRARRGLFQPVDRLGGGREDLVQVVGGGVGGRAFGEGGPLPAFSPPLPKGLALTPPPPSHSPNAPPP